MPSYLERYLAGEHEAVWAGPLWRRTSRADAPDAWQQTNDDAARQHDDHHGDRLGQWWLVDHQKEDAEQQRDIHVHAERQQAIVSARLQRYG